jgi:hypothetical protein
MHNTAKEQSNFILCTRFSRVETVILNFCCQVGYEHSKYPTYVKRHRAQNDTEGNETFYTVKKRRNERSTMIELFGIPA